MKRPLFLLVLLALSGSRLAVGQAPHSVGLEVQPVSAGSTVQSGTASSTGSYSSSHVRTTSAREALQITLRNFGTVPSAAKVQWYFVAVPLVLEPGKPAEDQEFVFDQGGQDVTLAGGATQALRAESAEVTSTKKLTGGRSSSRRSTSTSAKPKETGSALRGWMVRVVVDGKVVATRGSTQTYEEIAEDEESVQDLLNGAPPKEARKKKQPKK